MLSFLAWYLLSIILGWLTFPLVYRLFPALTDRGYTFSRAFGLLIWGYIFWLFASLGIAQNDAGGLLLGLVILAGISAWAYFTQYEVHTMQVWLRENRSLLLATELLFLIAFGFMAIVRAANPEIVGTEKPMELMMINGIINSPTFPPRDLWLSGYAISYYYFGYVMTSMLAMFTGVPATMAFNLMLALIFALTAIGVYGILYNLLTLFQRSKVEDQEVVHRKSEIVNSLFAPLFLLIVSNVEGFLEVLHRRGIFWTGTQSFWTWLDIPELRDAPAQPLQWIPDRFWWWWRASRVIMDYDLNGNWTLDVISEFPAFSFILGDLHPHVLAMPFLLLAVAVALNIFLGGWRGRIPLYFAELRIHRTGFFVTALVLGGLAFLNTWDILVAAALIIFSYALARVAEAGWGWERIEDILLLGIPLALTAYVMYLPFHIGFDSQAGGVVPNFMFPTRGAQMWVMWGTLFVPLFAFLMYSWRTKTPAHWQAGILITLGVVLILILVMFTLGFLAIRFKPDTVMTILQAQGRDVATFITDSMTRRFIYIGSLLTLMALLIPSFAFLFAGREPSIAGKSFLLHPSRFIFLLIALGALLILGPEFVYLRDQFGYRINTVFKFYHQAWILLSLASAYGVVVLLRSLRGLATGIFSIVFALVLIVGLTYPILGFINKTNNFKPMFGYTLDDFDRVLRENPDEAAAILWLRAAPDGVIAEAVGGAYSSYARISIYTGLPTVIGWENHEGQWRDRALQGTRRQDVETLYVSTDWFTTREIIERYQIRYIVVGNLERATYRVNEEKFNRFLRPVFQQGNVTIYEAP